MKSGVLIKSKNIKDESEFKRCPTRNHLRIFEENKYMLTELSCVLTYSLVQNLIVHYGRIKIMI